MTTSDLSGDAPGIGPEISLLTEAWRALGGDIAALGRVRFTGAPQLASAFPVNALATASIGVAALAVGELAAVAGTGAIAVAIDRRLAAMWFGMTFRPIGWKVGGTWDAIAGDYRTRDGWIRLHTNAPHHRAAVIRVLGECADKTAVQAALAREPSLALENAIVAAGGCAAEMRTLEAWRSHPQGLAVAEEPLIDWRPAGKARGGAWRPTARRPLKGLRVLDMTRVLAGPIATRFLAGYGAQVLRIDAPEWDEPSVAPEVTPGKRCARLDLRNIGDRSIFEGLLSEADVFIHGLRPDALARLGYDEAARATLAPGLIDVSLDAYGHTGPWAGRRGFDSLVQMSTGIAAAGMAWKQADRPVPLPVQALDHATGYLMAAAAVMALRSRLTEGTGQYARLSLARTAKLLVDHRGQSEAATFIPESEADLADGVDQTVWGPARRLRPPVAVEGAAMTWDLLPSPLGSARPAWHSS